MKNERNGESTTVVKTIRIELVIATLALFGKCRRERRFGRSDGQNKGAPVLAI
ncbi:MAG: hypothetical protein GIX03_07290 [Candidatus Eremiobacteraeota bacterium]|nr:hypothetical protein [Candidatus Eremiobacteraeota bacterium]MBC5802795.1 hypothetical protein [Candidatus Eremiobacteraeota bacterium]MBC5820542.1 hypothetical protein [Candidatus Eremiobacteraeota bacterium]